MSAKLSNNATSRLAVSLAPGDNTLSVQSGDGSKFPAISSPDWFPLTALKADGTIEIMKCTARSGDTFTVDRAQEGTTAKSFSANDRIELRLTVGTFESRMGEKMDKAGGTFTGQITVTGGDINVGAGGKIVMEGVTDDAFEATIDPGNPTADRTITLPDQSGTVAMTSDIDAQASISIVNLTGGSNATTPTTKFDLKADWVTMRNAAGQTKTFRNTGLLTVDISVASALGGRDQATAFANFAEPNVFMVPDGTGGVGLVASLADELVGPTGYTWWKLAANLKLNGTAQIYQGTVAGNKFTSAAPLPIAINGGGAFPVSTSTANYVPAAAVEVEYSMTYGVGTNSGGPGNGNVCLGLGSQEYLSVPFAINGANQNVSNGGSITLPQTSTRTISYGSASLVGSVATFVQSVRANRYTMRNGAR